MSNSVELMPDWRVRDDPSEHSDQAPVETGERRACLLSVESSSWYVTRNNSQLCQSVPTVKQSSLSWPLLVGLSCWSPQVRPRLKFYFDMRSSDLRSDRAVTRAVRKSDSRDRNRIKYFRMSHNLTLEDCHMTQDSKTNLHRHPTPGVPMTLNCSVWDCTILTWRTGWV